MDRSSRSRSALYVRRPGAIDPVARDVSGGYTPIDIFPKIDIPVVSIIWTYNGLATSEMEKRVTTFSEFVLATVNDIRSIESQTLNGVATIKVYFQPQVRIDAATAQINSAVNGIRFRMPPGINPPWILRFWRRHGPCDSARLEQRFVDRIRAV